MLQLSTITPHSSLYIFLICSKDCRIGTMPIPKERAYAKILTKFGIVQVFGCYYPAAFYLPLWGFHPFSSACRFRPSLAYLFNILFCTGYCPLARTRGDIIFSDVSIRVSISMRCVCYRRYPATSLRVRIAKPSP